MTIKERIGFVTMTIAAAFVGGAVSGHMFAASAIGAASAPRMITAQKFLLVDSHGKTRGELGITIVVVTHELGSVYAIADRCVLLDREARTIVAEGRPADLRDHSRDPRVRRFFQPELEPDRGAIAL